MDNSNPSVHGATIESKHFSLTSYTAKQLTYCLHLKKSHPEVGFCTVFYKNNVIIYLLVDFQKLLKLIPSFKMPAVTQRQPSSTNYLPLD